MKKSILTAALLICTSIFAQSKKISFGFGLSNPTGKFSGTNINDSSQGFGKIGSNFNLMFESLNEKNIGYYIQYNTTGIGFDLEDYQSKIGNNTLINDAASSKRYNITSLNFGFASKFNIIKAIEVSSNIGLGISSCRDNSFTLNYIEKATLDRYALKKDENKSTNINFNINLRLNFNLSSKTQLFIGTIYQWQKTTFKPTYTYYVNDTKFTTLTQNEKKGMDFDVLNFGLAFKL